MPENKLFGQITHEIDTSGGATPAFADVAEAGEVDFTVADANTPGVQIVADRRQHACHPSQSDNYTIVLTRRRRCRERRSASTSTPTGSPRPRASTARFHAPIPTDRLRPIQGRHDPSRRRQLEPARHDRARAAADPARRQRRLSRSAPSPVGRIVLSPIQGPLEIIGDVGDTDRSLQGRRRPPRRGQSRRSSRHRRPPTIPRASTTWSSSTTTASRPAPAADAHATITADQSAASELAAGAGLPGRPTSSRSLGSSSIAASPSARSRSPSSSWAHGDETIDIDGTLAGTMTVVHGGGGSDTITVTGASALGPLVIFGDTSDDGFVAGADTTPFFDRGRYSGSTGRRHHRRLGASRSTIPATTSSTRIWRGLGGRLWRRRQRHDLSAARAGDYLVRRPGQRHHLRQRRRRLHPRRLRPERRCTRRAGTMPRAISTTAPSRSSTRRPPPPTTSTAAPATTSSSATWARSRRSIR